MADAPKRRWREGGHPSVELPLAHAAKASRSFEN